MNEKNHSGWQSVSVVCTAIFTVGLVLLSVVSCAQQNYTDQYKVREACASSLDKEVVYNKEKQAWECTFPVSADRLKEDIKKLVE